VKLRFVMNLVVLVGLAGSLFAADPLVGTWKANVAKTKEIGKFPLKPVKEWIVVCEEHEGQLACSETGVFDDGSPILEKYTAPISGGAVNFSQTALPKGVSMTLSRGEDSHTTDWPSWIGGKVVATARDVVSSDGKTLTVTMRGNDAEGKPWERVVVLERQ